jgi:hypothetical protein
MHSLQKATFLTVLLVFSVCAHASSSPLREIGPSDDPDTLSSKVKLERNAQVLNDKTPKHILLKAQPWANGMWKMNSGLIAVRYAETRFIQQNDFQSRMSYIQKNSAQSILQIADSHDRARKLDQLSPAEKYDLLVGDNQGTLTESQWSEGRKFFESKTLADWMGICEGSAAASVMYPEPKHEVDLKLASGDHLHFHIMDIKALEALLWSSYNVHIAISGGRCKTLNPSEDENGVITDENCFDGNPGSFYIAVLNFLGLEKRPFFINRVKAIEVWNVPVVGYEVSYYNLKTGHYTSGLKDAIVPIEQIPANDKFRKYRSSQTKSVVGVYLTIQMAMGRTIHRDQTASTVNTQATYKLDLELNEAGEIVGGEWHQEDHPNFMWQVDRDFKPESIGDALLGDNTTWDGGIVPASWLESVRQSSRLNQPMDLIVKKLVELSQ